MALRALCVLYAGFVLLGCTTRGGQIAGRALGTVAVAVADAAINNAIDQRQQRRDQQRAERAAREVPLPPPGDATRLADTGPLNEPGEAPTEHGLRRAFDGMRDQLAACAPRGSGRLVIQARVYGGAGQAVREQLYGAAATTVDEDCVDRALAGVRFERFLGTVDTYWTHLYVP